MIGTSVTIGSIIAAIAPAAGKFVWSEFKQRRVEAGRKVLLEEFAFGTTPLLDILVNDDLLACVFHFDRA